MDGAISAHIGKKVDISNTLVKDNQNQNDLGAGM